MFAGAALFVIFGGSDPPIFAFHWIAACSLLVAIATSRHTRPRAADTGPRGDGIVPPPSPAGWLPLWIATISNVGFTFGGNILVSVAGFSEAQLADYSLATRVAALGTFPLTIAVSLASTDVAQADWNSAFARSRLEGVLRRMTASASLGTLVCTVAILAMGPELFGALSGGSHEAWMLTLALLVGASGNVAAGPAGVVLSLRGLELESLMVVLSGSVATLLLMAAAASTQSLLLIALGSSSGLVLTAAVQARVADHRTGIKTWIGW